MNKTQASLKLNAIAQIDKQTIWHHLTQHRLFEKSEPMVITKGSGLRVWDSNGREFLDAVSGGLWTVNVGYGRESMAKAVYEQLLEMPFFAGTAGTIPGALFAEKLLGKMPGMSRVYFSNSGSEANEKAYKIVRQIAHKCYEGKKHKIIFRERDYHGTTITALSSSGQQQRKEQYGPMTPGFVEMPHCCEYRSQYGEINNYGILAAETLENVILREGADTVGALILEPITAGGGVITPPEGYWKTIQSICDKYNILLILDEVVCGLGRTGEWFGYQHYGIKPDIVTMAKGVASGYAAISCTVTTEEIFNLFRDDENDPLDYFRDVSTFGGCASGPAAALENMRIIEEEDLLVNCTKIGRYLKTKLESLMIKHPSIGDVRGKGLLCGFELVQDRDSKEPIEESVAMAVVAKCLENGLIIGRTNRSFYKFNNTIVLSPALVATHSDIDQIVEVIDVSLQNVLSRN